MAVTFKVPSSPKKDVFEIDNFLGVDLTNSGANIDEVRSPNAPNMIRSVPGKVRKRTGYKTRVRFTDDTDVNRASGNWTEWNDLDVTATTLETADKICDLYDTVEAGSALSVCLDIDAVGSYIIVCGSISFEVNGTTEEPYVGKKSAYNNTLTSEASEIVIYHNGDIGEYDYVHISKIKAFTKTSAVSVDGVSEVPYQLAPEDASVIWQRTDSNERVNGVHSLVVGTNQISPVVDVNRLKHWSHSDWRTYNGGKSNNWGFLYDNIPGGQTIYIQFDYRNVVYSAGKTSAKLCFDSGKLTISGTSGTFNQTYTIPRGTRIQTFWVEDVETLQIRNFIITYEKSDITIAWSESPESVGDTFDIKAIYETYGDNQSYKTTSTFGGTYTDAGRNLNATLTSAGDYRDMQGLWQIDFDSSCNVTAADGEDVFVFIRIVLRDVAEPHTLTYWQMTPGQIQNYSDKHYTYYVDCPSGKQIYAISIHFTFADSGIHTYTYTANTKNNDLRQARIKSSYVNSGSVTVYHVGNSLYKQINDENELTKITDSMRNIKSCSWAIGNNLYFVDGGTLRRINGVTSNIETVSDVATVPTVTIAKSPSGGGITYSAYNLLQPGFIEEFTGDGTSTVYQLTQTNLDNRTPSVWLLVNGSWVAQTYATHFSYNKDNGTITFVTAPQNGHGVDNVRIQAYKTFADYAGRINKCTIGTLFGVNGELDRLFLSGNPDHPNWDFYSEKDDPTYFPDNGYSSLGSEKSAIVGYSKVNNYLATHKDGLELEQNILVREGDLVVREEQVGDVTYPFSDPAFKLINTIQGEGAYGKYTFCTLETEPLFLTKLGLYAITPQDMTGEKYGQNRSFYLNGQLLDEPNLDEAYAVVFNDMYFLAINNKLYVLDGLQPVRTDKSAPYATRQYTGFLLTDIPANILFVKDDALWVGTTDGKVCRFATDVDDLDSYSDNGKAIYCCWETPDLDGKLFYKNKSFRYIAVRLMKAMRTSCKMYSEKLGVWTFIKEDKTSGITFTFEDIDFESFSFSTDNSEALSHSKARVKKADKARFRIENGNLNEPFGLYNLALEYVESGNYKG